MEYNSSTASVARIGGFEMKKITLIGFGLILLLTFVAATNYDSQSGYMDLVLNKGWNLVPLGNMSECSNVIKATYWYSPSANEYAGAILENNRVVEYVPNQEKYNQVSAKISQAPNFVKTITSVWAYSTDNCIGKMNLGSQNSFSVTNTDLEGHNLIEGWNFLAVSPWMIGKNLKDMFDNCEVTGFNVWDSNNQKWNYASSSSASSQLSQSTGIIREYDVGGGILVKVASYCALSTEEAAVSPPAIPNLPN